MSFIVTQTTAVSSCFVNTSVSWPSIACCLSKQSIQITLNSDWIGFRWITLLLSQEFDLPDVLRLWDSFFGDEKRFEYLLHTCVAMLILVRDKLLASGFGDSLKLLQKYTITDINHLISLADDVSYSSYRFDRESGVYIEKGSQKPNEQKDPLTSLLDGITEIGTGFVQLSGNWNLFGWAHWSVWRVLEKMFTIMWCYRVTGLMR